MCDTSQALSCQVDVLGQVVDHQVKDIEEFFQDDDQLIVLIYF